jgi:3-oxoacyl-[acyl-carrier-protein] synthase-3
MPYAQITGWGKYVPDTVVTNRNLVKMGVDTSDEWITSRTGIERRRIAAVGQSTSELAVQAAWPALEVASVHPGSVDLIIVATSTPDHRMPATASIVQGRLGASSAGALDVNAACSGFVYALTLAAGQIESGRATRVLVIGADTVSAHLNWQDRSTCVLFGDGAGALVLQAAREPGILSAVTGSDGSGADLLMVPAGAPPNDANLNGAQNGPAYLTMNGPQIFRWATQVMGKAADTAITSSGLTPEEIDLFIPHQANLRIIETMAHRLGVPTEKVFVNVGDYGNTTAASIPIAFCEVVEQELVKPGDNVALTSFGAGLAWAAAVIRWTIPLPVDVSRWDHLKHRLDGPLATIRSTLRQSGRKVGASLPKPFGHDDEE